MAAMGNPYQQYKQNSVNTAGPGELVLMMYDGALKCCRQACSFIEQKDIQNSNNSIIKAQKIITELMSSLDMNYQVSNNLYSLYSYMNSRLIQANINKDVQTIKEIETMLEELKDAWKEAVRINRQQVYSHS